MSGGVITKGLEPLYLQGTLEYLYFFKKQKCDKVRLAAMERMDGREWAGRLSAPEVRVTGPSLGSGSGHGGNGRT